MGHPLRGLVIQFHSKNAQTIQDIQNCRKVCPFVISKKFAVVSVFFSGIEYITNSIPGGLFLIAPRTSVVGISVWKGILGWCLFGKASFFQCFPQQMGPPRCVLQTDLFFS